jgi:hypothetical protein
VKGSLFGGNGTESGAIGSHGPIKSVEIGTDGGFNSLTGGMGSNSGEVVSSKGIQNVIIHGSLVGGQGDTSGAIGSTKALGTVTIEGNLLGGTGARSGEIVSAASIGDVTSQAIFSGDKEMRAVRSVQLGQWDPSRSAATSSAVPVSTRDGLFPEKKSGQ